MLVIRAKGRMRLHQVRLDGIYLGKLGAIKTRWESVIVAPSLSLKGHFSTCAKSLGRLTTLGLLFSLLHFDAWVKVVN